MQCHSCTNKLPFGGSCHIGCVNPPTIVAKSTNASEENKKIAQEAIDKIKKEQPDIKVVYRCVWGGSGTFPIYYDPNTVLACSNYDIKGEPRPENPLTSMMAILKTERE